MDQPTSGPDQPERLVHVVIPAWQIPGYFAPMEADPAPMLRILQPPIQDISRVRQTSIVPGRNPAEGEETNTELEAQGLKLVSRVGKEYALVFDYAVFNKLQSAAFDQIFLEGKNAVIVAPTGAGKTDVMTLAILRTLKEDIDLSARVVYIAPFKELCEERAADWLKRFMKIKEDVAYLTGDSSASDKMRALAARIIVTTPEKWEYITSKRERPEWQMILTKVKLLLLDECHILDEPRGRSLETLLSRTRVIFKTEHDIKPRIIAVSATIPNPVDLQRWISYEPYNEGIAVDDTIVLEFGAEYRTTELVKRVWEITWKEEEHVFVTDRRATHQVLPIFQTLGRGEPSMVLCNSRRDVEHLASVLCAFVTSQTPKQWRANVMENNERVLQSTIGATRRGYVENQLQELEQYDRPEPDSDDFNDNADNNRIDFDISTLLPKWRYPDLAEVEHCKDPWVRQALKCGVAVHHADLVPEDRRLVTRLIKAKKISITCATSTISTGVNLPFKLVILKMPVIYKTKDETEPVPLRSIFQTAGRAGRPGIWPQGIAVIVATRGDMADGYVDNFVNKDGPTDPLVSHMEQYNVSYFLLDVALEYIRTLDEGRLWQDKLFYSSEQRSTPIEAWLDQEGFSDDFVQQVYVRFGRDLAFGRKIEVITWYCELNDLIEVEASGVLRITPLGRLFGQYRVRPYEMDEILEWQITDWSLKALADIAGKITPGDPSGGVDVKRWFTAVPDERGKIRGDVVRKQSVDAVIWFISFAIFFARTRGCPMKRVKLLLGKLKQLSCGPNCYVCKVALDIEKEIAEWNAESGQVLDASSDEEEGMALDDEGGDDDDQQDAPPQATSQKGHRVSPRSAAAKRQRLDEEGQVYTGPPTSTSSSLPSRPPASTSSLPSRPPARRQASQASRPPWRG